MSSIRVALPGYDALTDTNPDHFALYSDEDWVLIKEFTRGTIAIAGSSSETITHDLGYIPFISVYAGSGHFIHGYNLYEDFKWYATTTTLVLINSDAAEKTFRYYIFYDRQL